MDKFEGRLERGRSGGLFDVEGWTRGYESVLRGAWEAAVSAEEGRHVAWAHVIIPEH